MAQVAQTGKLGGDVVASDFEISSRAVTTTGNYVDVTQITNLGLQKQDMDETLVKRYGEQGITGMLQAMGNVKATGSDEFMHFEERMLHDEYTLAGSTAVTDADESNTAIGDNANDRRLTISSSDLAATIRPNAVLKMQEATFGGELLLVKAVNGDKVDVAPYAGDYASNTASDYNSAKFIIIGLEFGKGGEQPSGLEPKVDKKYGRTAIFKESFAVSGSDATQVVYVKVNSPSTGKSGYVWYLKGEGDTRMRFENYMEAQMLFMDKVTSSSGLAGPTGTGGNITGYQGLLSKVLEEGIEDLAHAQGGVVDDDQVESWIDAIDKQRGAKEYTAFCGLNYSLAIDKWLATKNSYYDGGTNYGAFNNSKDMALNLGFTSFHKGGYTFHKKTYELFNQRGMAGTLGYRDRALFMPAGMSKSPNGVNLPSLQIRYREANGYSRQMEHWLTGSAVLQTPNSTEDVLKCHYRTERGLQVYGANRFMISDILGS